MVSIDDYKQEKKCWYKGELYSVRDNGAIMRHSRDNMRKRSKDEVWTFGKPNEKNGYMEFIGLGVHRIVAFAFLGEPPTDNYVVDHIDTNRRNNRPNNLRWVTRLENVLNNPITRARIENVCGSVEAFLANPSILRGHEHIDPNFGWMRAVSKEEAQLSLERLTKWAKEHPKSQGGKIGEWVFQDHKESTVINAHNNLEFVAPKSDEIANETHSKLSLDLDLMAKWINEEKYQNHQASFAPNTQNNNSELITSEHNEDSNEDTNETQALTPNAIQIDWRIPSEFPCCPQFVSENPLDDYKSNLKIGAVFCKNDTYKSYVKDFAIAEDGKCLLIVCRTEWIKKWALTKITYKDGVFIHQNWGTFFRKDGVDKYFTIEQGKEWTGGDVFDDFC